MPMQPSSTPASGSLAEMTLGSLLRSTDEGEHNAHNYYDNCQPYEEVSATHSSRSYAAETEQRGHERDND